MIARPSTALVCVLICGRVQTSLANAPQNPEPLAAVSSTTAAIVQKVELDPQPDRLRVKVTVSAPVVPETRQLANPDRLVFDFLGCELKGGNRHIPVNRGPVKELRLSLFTVHPPVTRVVVDSKEPLEFEVKPAGNGIVMIEIPFPKAAAASAAPVRPPVVVEKETVAPGQPPQKPPEREIARPAASPQTSAYSLMAKARTLSVGDLQALEEKAQAGDPEAQTMLALAYHSGVLLKKDDMEAVRLLHQASDRGFMAAEESLGIFSETGVGMAEPAPAEALDWYKKAARQGSSDAATNIALIYANGKGVARDPAQALTWFRRAADAGDASAQYNLALMYERGEGVAQDYKDAVHWLRLAADQNLVPALLDLAELSLHPPDSKTAADMGSAVRYYEKAADLGSGPAQAVLGTVFAKGLLGKVDYEQAVKWYRKAAEQGESEGQLGLGVSYALGQGVPVDLGEARRLLTAASDHGQVEAQYDLAIMCEEGRGAPADRDLAAHYYQMAANRGFVKAQFRYGRFLASGSDSQGDRISAYKWLMLAQDSIQESSPVLSDLRKLMSAQEIAEAERAVDNWRAEHRRNGR